jgi:hypothetical protein
MRAVEKKRSKPKFLFFHTPVDHPRDPPITSLFCQVGEQFTQAGNAVSRRKARQKAKAKAKRQKCGREAARLSSSIFAF